LDVAERGQYTTMTILVTGAAGNVGTATRKQPTLARTALSIHASVHGGVLITRVSGWLG
jgi:inosine-uridine nucleoside N-ribohydrolase